MVFAIALALSFQLLALLACGAFDRGARRVASPVEKSHRSRFEGDSWYGEARDRFSLLSDTRRRN